MTPITRNAHRANDRHDATGRKPAQPANDAVWPFRWLADPREVKL